MALFKSKSKEFSIKDFSPVLNKVIEFNAKKGRLTADLQANEEKIQVLAAQSEEVREKYADSLNDADLNNFVALEGELNALKSVVKAQKEILVKGDKREYVLSKVEEKSLMESFQPIRQKRDDITRKLTEQIAEVEKTLDELAEENKVIQEAWAKVWGPLITASQENWMIGNKLNQQREASVAQVTLGVLRRHEALNIHNWHR